MKFAESKLAHQLLDGLKGVELGGASHNPFGLKTRNVDITASMDTVFKRAEIDLCSEAMPVDIVARADKLPLEDESVDFVISSHVLEHVYDVIGCLAEWERVVRPGGYIFCIVPKPDALASDAGRPRTTLAGLLERHGKPDPDIDCHWNVWSIVEAIELLGYMNMLDGRWWQPVALLETDEKVGNGWCFVVRKT